MVNTFLPYSDYSKCAQVLDNQRLNKQRIEANQILRLIIDLKIVSDLGFFADNVKEIAKSYLHSNIRITVVGVVALIHRKDEHYAGRLIKLGYAYHPITRMWYGYEDSLKSYINAMRLEWLSRGFKCNLPEYEIVDKIIHPWWFGDERVHSSHQRSLLYKLPEWYDQYFPTEIAEYNYFWP